MTRFSLFAALTAVVLSISLVCPAFAQHGGATAYQPGMTTGGAPAASPRAASPIGLIDIQTVFKSLSRFKAAQEQVVADMQQFETWAKGEQDALRNLANKMREFKPGTAEFKEAEKEIVKREYNLKIEVELKRKDFRQRQGMIYFAAYREVQQEVQSIAAERGFALVLRYNGAEAAPDNPDQVLMELEKQVLFFNRDLDITNEVIARLERRAANYGASADTRATIPMRQPNNSQSMQR
ncbi:MAG: OmpH family outer membrane protein [Pirellulaceae bacterium]|nr:OmpH family outer membrane protein [Pirellulaceae bacterium]